MSDNYFIRAVLFVLASRYGIAESASVIARIESAIADANRIGATLKSGYVGEVARRVVNAEAAARNDAVWQGRWAF